MSNILFCFYISRKAQEENDDDGQGAGNKAWTYSMPKGGAATWGRWVRERHNSLFLWSFSYTSEGLHHGEQSFLYS